MFRLFHRNTPIEMNACESTLYDQNTFYDAFVSSLSICQNELIIESPFITSKRMEMLLPIFAKLRQRNVKIIINTRNPDDHEHIYRKQALYSINKMQNLGVIVLYTVGHHRKLAIIDKYTIWEGSLNILSFNDSCEIMRRITSVALANQLIKFTGLDKYLNKWSWYEKK